MRTAPPVSSSSPAARQGRFWPVFIIAVLVGQVSFLSILVFFATRDPSFAVEPNYYLKALQWNDTAAQIQANAQLGWSVSTDLGNDVSLLGERWLVCRLQDAEGQPIGGAQMELTAFAHARADERMKIALAEAEAGSYSAKLRLRTSGLWDFEITARRGEQTFTHREQREVRPPGEASPW